MITLIGIVAGRFLVRIFNDFFILRFSMIFNAYVNMYSINITTTKQPMQCVFCWVDVPNVYIYIYIYFVI